MERCTQRKKTHSHTLLIQVCRHNMGGNMVFSVSLTHSHTQCRDQFQSLAPSSSLKHSHRGFAASPSAWNKELIAAFCFTVQPPTRSSPPERRLLTLRFLCLNIHTCTFGLKAVTLAGTTNICFAFNTPLRHLVTGGELEL